MQPNCQITNKYLILLKTDFKSRFTNEKQTPLSRFQQLPAPPSAFKTTLKINITRDQNGTTSL